MNTGQRRTNRYAAALFIALTTSVVIVLASLTNALENAQVFV